MARPFNLRGGRPSRYTRDIAAEILTRMCEGESLVKICRDDRMPGDATVRRWADSGQHPEFSAAFERARQHQAHRWFEEAIDLADESQCVETVPQLGSYQLRVNARRWASGKLVAQYGERAAAAISARTQIIVTLPAKLEAGEAGRLIEGQAVEIEEEPGDTAAT